MSIGKAIGCFYCGNLVLCLCGLCFQGLLDCSLAALCGSLPTGHALVLWHRPGAFVGTSGNVIALSWEEMISGMELLLSIGRCYLTAMKR